MPSHQERRKPLPKSFQFGDGKLPRVVVNYLELVHTGNKAYDRNIRLKVLGHWNVIEGEHDIEGAPV